MPAIAIGRKDVKPYNLHESRCLTWEGRADAAVGLWSEYLTNRPGERPAVWRIADIGCGDEKLRGPLSRAGIPFEYIGFDKLPQTASCRPLDLSRDVPDDTFDFAFCLGVFEYLADIPSLLTRLRRVSPRIVVSYVIADSAVYSPEQVAERGWLHHYTAAEMEVMFARAGFVCRGATRLDEGRSAVWLLESSEAPTKICNYAMLTPFPIPSSLTDRKVPNLGDGFIEKAIADQFQPHGCRGAYSTRIPLSDEAIERINDAKLLLLAGANQLNDNYTIAPGMDPKQFARIRVPIVPVGIGIHGIASYTQRMSAAARELLLLLHERIRFSSWRCPGSVDYLLRHCPELSDQALMTGCPVTYGDPLLHGHPFSTATDRIAVTVTERHDFWDRETRTIDFVARQFPRAEKTLSLHQHYPPSADDGAKLTWTERLTGRGPRTPGRLATYARQRGFTVWAPGSVAECQAFYQRCDLHIGSRLHAHLYFLSRAKRSFLSYVDDRSAGMSRSLGFPLCDPREWRQHMDYDFEQYRTAARRCHQSMVRFNASLREIMS